jgi:hypothetical protein
MAAYLGNGHSIQWHWRKKESFIGRNEDEMRVNLL